MRIYAVEDSPAVCDRLVSLIKGIDGAVFVGSSDTASKAIDEIVSIRPDVVILDLALKHGTGFDVLTFAKQLIPSPTVIVQTNYATSAFRRKCVNAGSDYFLDKSMEFERLAEVLKELAKRSASVGGANRNAIPQGQ